MKGKNQRFIDNNIPGWSDCQELNPHVPETWLPSPWPPWPRTSTPPWPPWPAPSPSPGSWWQRSWAAPASFAGAESWCGTPSWCAAPGSSSSRSWRCRSGQPRTSRARRAGWEPEAERLSLVAKLRGWFVRWPVSWWVGSVDPLHPKTCSQRLWPVLCWRGAGWEAWWSSGSSWWRPGLCWSGGWWQGLYWSADYWAGRCFCQQPAINE